MLNTKRRIRASQLMKRVILLTSLLLLGGWTRKLRALRCGPHIYKRNCALNIPGLKKAVEGTSISGINIELSSYGFQVFFMAWHLAIRN
jgi:hypothetical protein